VELLIAPGAGDQDFSDTTVPRKVGRCTACLSF